MANQTVWCNNSLIQSTGFLLPRTRNHLVSSSTSLTRGSGSDHITTRTTTRFSARAGGVSVNSILKRCQKCAGKGAIECPGCKGTGKNKKNGNIFERWKCFDCQGFGLKSCPNCGKGGLTPEQRGER